MKAIYALSADPVHLGHIWVIEKASLLTEELIVAIGDNSDKKYLFSLEDRLQMLSESVSHLKNVKVTSYPKMFLADFAKKQNISVLIRGIRSADDFNYERRLQDFNVMAWPKLTTLYISPPADICILQSSLVRGIMGYENWEEYASQMVPDEVFKRLKKWKSLTDSGPSGLLLPINVN